MAETIHADIQAALDEGRVVENFMVRFNLDSGTYGFWTGLGIHESGPGGVDYQGAGSLMEVAAISETQDATSIPIEIRFSSVPNTDLTPDVLAGIESETYKGRTVRIYRIYKDASTRANLGPPREVWAGTIDQVEHIWSVGAEAVLLIKCESRSLDAQKTGYRMRSNEDQKLIDASDKFFHHSATAGSESIEWGKRPDKRAATGKLSGGRGRGLRPGQD